MQQQKPRIAKKQIQILKNQFKKMENYLEVQWIGLWASTAGNMVLIPGQGTKILQAVQHGQKKKKKQLKNKVVQPSILAFHEILYC